MENVYRLASLIDVSESYGAAKQPDGSVNYRKRIQIMPLGAPRMADGRQFKVSPEDLARVMADLSTRKNQIAVLYEHADGPKGEEAAGWIREFEVTDRGLFGYVVWNVDAASAIKSGKWKYLSPGFMGALDEEGFIRPRVLLEVSLTNIPAIDGMDPVTARVAPGADGAHTPVEAGSTPAPAPDPIKEETMALSKEALELLGLAEGASNEDIEQTLKATLGAMKCPDCGGRMTCLACSKEKKSAEPEVKMEAAPPPAPVPEPPPAPAPPPEPPPVTFTAEQLEAAKAEAEAKVRAEFEAKAKAERVAALMAKAEAEGKLSADNRETFRAACEKDLAGAESLLATMSPIAPVARTVSSKPPHVKAWASEGERLTALFQKVARTGLPLEIVKKQSES